MNGKLLDTNIIIRYIKDEDNLDDIFEEENLFYSSVTKFALRQAKLTNVS